MGLFEKRLHLSRAILLAMLVLFVVGQFFPWHPLRAVWTIWPLIGGELLNLFHGRFSEEGLVVSSLFVSMGLFVLTAPWLVGFLARAQPLLWILRVLLIGLGGYLVYYRYKDFPSVGWEDLPGIGFYCLLASVWVGVLGLFVIPKGPRVMPVGVQPLEES